MTQAMPNARRCGSRVAHQLAMTGWIAINLVGLCILPIAEARAQGRFHEAIIPVLGITMEKDPTGQVVYLVLSFEKRGDDGGLAVLFKSTPGRFSRMTQTAIEEAIYRTAHALGVSPHSWTVMLSLPYPGVTIYGESCTAMVALSVAVLARGGDIPADRVITGTVTPDGHIGPVGAVPLKLAAANEAHLRQVLVPDEQDGTEADWETPFLMQVSPIGSVAQAYRAFTDLQSIP